MPKISLISIGAFFGAIFTVIIHNATGGQSTPEEGGLPFIFLVLILFVSGFYSAVSIFFYLRNKAIAGVRAVSPGKAVQWEDRIQRKRAEGDAEWKFEKEHRAYRRKQAIYELNNPRWRDYYNTRGGVPQPKQGRPRGHIPGFTATPPPPPKPPRRKGF